MAIRITTYLETYEEVSRFRSQEWVEVAALPYSQQNKLIVKSADVDLTWCGDKHGSVTLVRNSTDQHAANHGIILVWGKTSQKTYRQFRVNIDSPVTDRLFDELVAHYGVEKFRVNALNQITASNTVDVLKDSQQYKLYEVEATFFHILDAKKGPNVKRSYNSFYSAHRNRSHQNAGRDERDPEYGMSPMQIEDLVYDVRKMYDLPFVSVTKEYPKKLVGGDSTIAALLYQRGKLFAAHESSLKFYYNPAYTMKRKVIVHELAHLVDTCEFGFSSHGPMFCLIYCELASKMLDGVDFDEMYEFFTSQGLKVASKDWRI